MKNKKFDFWIIITIIAILIDQVVKVIISRELVDCIISIIPNVLNLTYVQNTGAAFGIGNNSTSMFIIVNVIVIGLIVYFIFSKKEEISKAILVSLHLIIAGGISNLIDRIIHGYVIDFIDFYIFNYNYPVFNLADSFICIGILMLLYSIYLGEDNENSSK